MLASERRSASVLKKGSGLCSSASPVGVNADPFSASKILLYASLKWKTKKPEVGRQVYCSV